MGLRSTTTSIDEGFVPHNHKAKIDKNGNGVTQSSSAGPDHTHEIVNNEVKAGGKDGHTHELPQLILQEEV